MKASPLLRSVLNLIPEGVRSDCPSTHGWYSCTRDKDHPGPHVAHGDSCVVAFWSTEFEEVTR